MLLVRLYAMQCIPREVKLKIAAKLNLDGLLALGITPGKIRVPSGLRSAIESRQKPHSEPLGQWNDWQCRFAVEIPMNHGSKSLFMIHAPAAGLVEYGTRHRFRYRNGARSIIVFWAELDSTAGKIVIRTFDKLHAVNEATDMEEIYDLLTQCHDDDSWVMTT